MWWFDDVEKQLGVMLELLRRRLTIALGGIGQSNSRKIEHHLVSLHACASLTTETTYICALVTRYQHAVPYTYFSD